MVTFTEEIRNGKLHFLSRAQLNQIVRVSFELIADSKNIIDRTGFSKTRFSLGITKPCTHLHPASSTSTQHHPPPPSSTQVHPSPLNSFQPPLGSIHLQPAHFSLQPVLCNTSNNISTKILHLIVQFPQI